MNSTTPKRAVRELDSRTNDRIEVRLLWNSSNDSVSVSVDDTRYGESFEFDVAPAHALEAFRHPFAYAGNDRDPRSPRPERRAAAAAQPRPSGSRARRMSHAREEE
jgi:hypothetical protein